MSNPAKRVQPLPVDSDKISSGMAYGGYSGNIVVQQALVLKTLNNLDFAAAEPLLFSAITAYSPLRHNPVTTGQKDGIDGLGQGLYSHHP
jgi:uncharacterized zinc-type alcohol dehydrogenase-like protein